MIVDVLKGKWERGNSKYVETPDQIIISFQTSQADQASLR